MLDDFDGMRRHIQTLRAPDFDPGAPPTHQIRLSPTSVKTARSVLRGSHRTDGFRLQRLAFKMNELNSVKYKQLPHNVLPSRLTSIVGGVGYYLDEIRNIVKTPQDVVTLWGCTPDEIKILGIDLGQACVVGASALLPEPLPLNKTSKKTRVVFHNLAVKQKAVYQPLFK
ncbi:hypothetical protein EC968_003792 [Mortierella alpina]|nr:hypothetical protein EC968_003792 [Mortierella alpina]